MTKTRQDAKDKYLKEKVDTFVVRVAKGEKEKIQEYAKSLGKSLNAYITELIQSDMNGEIISKAAPKKEEVTPIKRQRSSLPDFLD